MAAGRSRRSLTFPPGVRLLAESSLRNGDRVEDRIRLHRQADTRAAFVVEGPDDELLLSYHLPRAVFFPAGGRSNVISAAEALERWRVKRFVALVDADYLPTPPAPVRCYQGRDLEGMLVQLGALEILIDHQGSRQKVANAGGSEALVARLVESASFLSALRAVNARDSLGLPFDSVDLFKKVDPNTLELSKRELCQALLARCSADVTPDELVDAALKVEDDGLGPSGKDVTGLAGVALRKLIGTLPHAVADPKYLLPHLRSGAILLVKESPWLATMSAEVAAA